MFLVFWYQSFSGQKNYRYIQRNLQELDAPLSLPLIHQRGIGHLILIWLGRVVTKINEYCQIKLP